MKRIIIAGTGRAGTSVLVQLFAQYGYNVGDFTMDDYDARARAGFERSALSPDPEVEVIKDPWLFTYLPFVQPSEIRHLVIPVRDLAEAAESRVRNESNFVNHDWGWYGHVPGGMIYKLDVNHQQNLLAYGFHQLVEWAVRENVPFTFLHYPELVSDPDYIANRLRDLFPDSNRFYAAFREVVNAN